MGEFKVGAGKRAWTAEKRPQSFAAAGPLDDDPSAALCGLRLAIPAGSAGARAPHGVGLEAMVAVVRETGEAPPQDETLMPDLLQSPNPLAGAMDPDEAGGAKKKVRI